MMGKTDCVLYMTNVTSYENTVHIFIQINIFHHPIKRVDVQNFTYPHILGIIG